MSRPLPSRRDPHPALRVALLALGVVLMLLTPVAALLPGPAGFFLFAFGLALVLRNSLWARRRFAVLKRRWPRAGHLADRGLRRASAKRRRQRDATAARIIPELTSTPALPKGTAGMAVPATAFSVSDT